MKTLLAALMICLALPLAANAAPMTNDDVIRMVRAGLSDATVIQAVDGSPPGFDASPDGLVRLKQGGVSEPVIQRILSKSTGAGATPAPSAYPQPARTGQASCPNCGTQTLSTDHPPSWHPGDRVRVVNGALAPL